MLENTLTIIVHGPCVPVMAVSARTGSWPGTTAYVPSTGKKVCMHNFQTRAVTLLSSIRGLYGLKNP